MKSYPKSQKGKGKLQQLINSSIKIIGTKGFSDASVGDITRDAGVSYGLFYLYFKNKDDLLDELIRKYNHDLRYFLKNSTKDYSKRIEMEKAGFRAFFKWVHENIVFFNILLEAQIHRPEIFKWHYTTLAERYSAGLRKAIESGEIKKSDPEVMAYMLMGIADFLARRFIQWPKQSLEANVLHEVDKMIERLLGGETTQM
ncbi:TetR/AcrR family transcriptional regulator [Thermoplasmatales archaeon AK]|nr:TetR/AcrR family transcriptional regulator [Thermoplasmatales archaeon AK]